MTYFGAQPNSLGQGRRIDRVAEVVPDAVRHVIEVVGIPVHQLQDRSHHREVVALVLGTDEVRAANLAVLQNSRHRGVVVLDVNPVPDVSALPVQLGAPARQNVGDLAGDELLHVLVGPVVVQTVGDRGPARRRT